MLRPGRRGIAAWPSTFEVLQARRYVEEWKEHLLDFRGHGTRPDVEGVLSRLFQRLA